MPVFLAIPWNIILWTSITLVVFMGIVVMVLTAISAINMKKRREEVKETHQELSVGRRVIFAGGLYGKVVSISEQTCDVEVNSKCILTVSRFAIQELLDK